MVRSSIDQLLALFSGSLFHWSRTWGLTSSDSFPSFLCSLYFLISFLFSFVFHCNFWFASSCIKWPVEYTVVRSVKCNFVVVIDDEIEHLQDGNSKYKRNSDVIIFFLYAKLVTTNPFSISKCVLRFLSH